MSPKKILIVDDEVDLVETIRFPLELEGFQVLAAHNGEGTLAADGRYLFVVAARGIRDALLQEPGTLTRTYRETALPSLNVLAVRYLDGTYLVTNEVLIRTRKAERTLGVELTADRSRYEPGDRATVTVTTTDADGRPVAADVVIRGVGPAGREAAPGCSLPIHALANLASSLLGARAMTRLNASIASRFLPIFA